MRCHVLQPSEMCNPYLEYQMPARMAVPTVIFSSQYLQHRCSDSEAAQAMQSCMSQIGQANLQHLRHEPMGCWCHEPFPVGTCVAAHEAGCSKEKEELSRMQSFQHPLFLPSNLLVPQKKTRQGKVAFDRV